ncbi:unnamed protein product, partial [marine sediment metagenome]
MALASMREILLEARREHFAVGYFEAWSIESTQAIVNAAEEAGSPVVIGFNGGILTRSDRIVKPADIEVFGAVGKTYAEKATVP